MAALHSHPKARQTLRCPDRVNAGFISRIRTRFQRMRERQNQSSQQRKGVADFLMTHGPATGAGYLVYSPTCALNCSIGRRPASISVRTTWAHVPSSTFSEASICSSARLISASPISGISSLIAEMPDLMSDPDRGK